MSCTVALLALLLASSPLLPKNWLGLEIVGWAKDGSTIVWEGVDPEPRSDAGDELRYLVVTDADGHPVRVFKLREFQGGLSPCSAASCPGAAWRAAEPEEAADAWQNRNPVVGQGKRHALGFDDALPVGAMGGRPLSLSMVRSGRGCQKVTLIAHLGTFSTAVGEDRCDEGEEPERQIGGGAQVMWSPDGSRAAIAWVFRRFTVSGGGPSGAVRSYLVVVSRRSLATIDLLDAGAGAGAQALGTRLEKAGFVVSHRARAEKTRAATEIYFAEGFEAEAQEAAKVAGVPAEAVKPLSWKSPYGITVAAGKK
jgi:hypothetical protein